MAKSIFPFTSSPETQEPAAELPVFKEMAYDFDSNCLLRKNGRTYLVDKDDAIKIWIYKALRTRRFVYPAYTHAYGTEIEQAVGTVGNAELIESEVKRLILETIMVNPYIQEARSFTFNRVAAGLRVSFEVVSIYGRFTFESEVYNE